MKTPSVLVTDGVFCCQGVLPSRPEKRSKPNAGKDFGELAVDGKRPDADFQISGYLSFTVRGERTVTA